MRHNILKLNIGRMMAILLALIFTVSSIPMVSAADIGGDCGEGVKWSLEGGVLTISGNGVIPDYRERTNTAPWFKHADNIIAVKVEKGVTKIGNYAFFDLDELVAATIDDSVEEIGSYCFYGATELSVLSLGSGLKKIGNSAFEECESLISVRLHDTLESLGAKAFYRCISLNSIIVPASVKEMGPSAFAYCSSLKTAKVLANITELPYWTFYGCHQLAAVSISASIADMGVQALDNCDVLEKVVLGSTGEAADAIREKLPYTVKDIEEGADIQANPEYENQSSTSTTDKDGNKVTVDSTFKETENSSVSTEVTHTKGNGEFTSDVKVDAVIENQSGWSELKEQIVDAMAGREYAADKSPVDINVHLKGEPTISAKDLAVFEGKDSNISIHTSQGAVWEFNGKHIYEKNLGEKEYDLSYKLTRISDPSDKQKEIIGLSGYMVVFNSDIDFNVEILLPLDMGLARSTAVFFSPEKNGGYTRMQASVIDGFGVAHFYLGKVSKNAEYLIGINVTDNSVDYGDLENVIIPDEIAGDYPQMDYNEPIQYVITDVKSSWGLDFSQVTIFLIAGMLGCIIIVGVVVFIIFKSKNKNFYDPVLDGAKKVEAKKKNNTKKKK